MSDERQPDRDVQEPAPEARAAAPQSYKLFRSDELFQGQRMVCIEHAGSVYRLQITSRGKLILQK
jgi:hemin uptake protein HemP